MANGLAVEHRFRRILASLLTALCLGSTLWAVPSMDRYRTRSLQRIAQRAGLSQIADTLADGNYFGHYRWKDNELNIFVVDSVVDHIGVKLFDDAFRSQTYVTPIYNFLERFLLDEILPSGRQPGDLDLAKAAGVRITRGKLTDLPRIVRDTTLSFSCTLENGRKYSVAWERNGREVFAMTLPASYRLLGGYELDEATRRLSARILRADSGLAVGKPVDVSQLEKCDSIQGAYYIKKGGCYVLPIVNNDRYYFYNEGDSTASLLYAAGRYPVESLSNLLITGEIDNEMTASVRINHIMDERETFKVPLNTLLNYFRSQGFTLYFALTGIYPERDMIVAMFEAVDEMNGYEHLMRVSVSAPILQRRQGEIEVRLRPYIPLHDVKSLFSN